MLLIVENTLDEDTSIHWHGLIVPFQMDGVPGVSFPVIEARSTFTYEFPRKQSGTYWYHSHSGLQEQLGHYGPMIIDPAGADPVAYDREHVIVLSDWSFASLIQPMRCNGVGDWRVNMAASLPQEYSSIRWRSASAEGRETYA